MSIEQQVNINVTTTGLDKTSEDLTQATIKTKEFNQNLVQTSQQTDLSSRAFMKFFMGATQAAAGVSILFGSTSKEAAALTRQLNQAILIVYAFGGAMKVFETAPKLFGAIINTFEKISAAIKTANVAAIENTTTEVANSAAATEAAAAQTEYGAAVMAGIPAKLNASIAAVDYTIKLNAEAIAVSEAAEAQHELNYGLFEAQISEELAAGASAARLEELGLEADMEWVASDAAEEHTAALELEADALVAQRAELVALLPEQAGVTAGLSAMIMKAGIYVAAAAAVAYIIYQIYDSFTSAEKSAKSYEKALDGTVAKDEKLRSSLNESIESIGKLNIEWEVMSGAMTESEGKIAELQLDYSDKLAIMKQDTDKKIDDILDKYNTFWSKIKNVFSSGAADLKKSLTEQYDITSDDSKKQIKLAEETRDKVYNAWYEGIQKRIKSLEEYLAKTDKDTEDAAKTALENYKKYLNEEEELNKARIENRHAADLNTFDEEKELQENTLKYLKLQYATGIIDYTEYQTKVLSLNTETIKTTEKDLEELSDKITNTHKKLLVGPTEMTKYTSDFTDSIKGMWSKAEEKINDYQDTLKRLLADPKSSPDEIANAIKDIVSQEEIVNNLTKEYNYALETTKEKVKDWLSEINNIGQTIENISTQSYNNAQTASDNYYNREYKNLETLHNAKRMTDAQYQKEKTALDVKNAEAQKQLHIKQAQDDKASKAFGIIMATAEAEMQGYAQLGPIGGAIAAAITAAIGAVELGLVMSQPLPTFAKGGLVKMGTGGVVPTDTGTDTVPAMLTPGEFVMNKKTTQQFLPELYNMNNGQGNLAKEIGAEIANNLIVVNNVQQTSTLQDRIVRVRNRAFLK